MKHAPGTPASISPKPRGWKSVMWACDKWSAILTRNYPQLSAIMKVYSPRWLREVAPWRCPCRRTHGPMAAGFLQFLGGLLENHEIPMKNGKKNQSKIAPASEANVGLNITSNLSQSSSPEVVVSIGMSTCTHQVIGAWDERVRDLAWLNHSLPRLSSKRSVRGESLWIALW